ADAVSRRATPPPHRKQTCWKRRYRDGTGRPRRADQPSALRAAKAQRRASRFRLDAAAYDARRQRTERGGVPGQRSRHAGDADSRAVLDADGMTLVEFVVDIELGIEGIDVELGPIRRRSDIDGYGEAIRHLAPVIGRIEIGRGDGQRLAVESHVGEVMLLGGIFEGLVMKLGDVGLA